MTEAEWSWYQDNWADHVFQTVDLNKQFCEREPEARQAMQEIIALGTEAFQHFLWAMMLKDWDGKRRRFCMLNYMYLVLRPSPDAIMLNFLTANLPYCFVQLRALLEQLGKCFQADADYRGENAFQEKLRKLEARVRKGNPTMTKLVSSLDPKGAELYRSLSDDWVHMRSFERLVDTMTQKGVPAYAVSVLMPYGPTELADISELGKSIEIFRKILSPTLERWKADYIPANERYLAHGNNEIQR